MCIWLFAYSVLVLVYGRVLALRWVVRLPQRDAKSVCVRGTVPRYLVQASDTSECENGRHTTGADAFRSVAGRWRFRNFRLSHP